MAAKKKRDIQNECDGDSLQSPVSLMVVLRRGRPLWSNTALAGDAPNKKERRFKERVCFKFVI